MRWGGWAAHPGTAVCRKIRAVGQSSRVVHPRHFGVCCSSSIGTKGCGGAASCSSHYYKTFVGRPRASRLPLPPPRSPAADSSKKQKGIRREDEPDECVHWQPAALEPLAGVAPCIRGAASCLGMLPSTRITSWSPPPPSPYEGTGPARTSGRARAPSRTRWRRLVSTGRC